MVAVTTSMPATHADWLRECHGFRVDSPAGRIGLVEDVLLDNADEVIALRIAAGRTGHRMLLVDARDVVRIVPHERRLRLVAQPHVLATYRGDGHPSRPRL